MKLTRITQTRRRTIRWSVPGRPFKENTPGPEAPKPPLTRRLLDWVHSITRIAGGLVFLSGFLPLVGGLVALASLGYGQTYQGTLQDYQVLTTGAPQPYPPAPKFQQQVNFSIHSASIAGTLTMTPSGPLTAVEQSGYWNIQPGYTVAFSYSGTVTNPGSQSDSVLLEMNGGVPGCQDTIVINFKPVPAMGAIPFSASATCAPNRQAVSSEDVISLAFAWTFTLLGPDAGEVLVGASLDYAMSRASPSGGDVNQPPPAVTNAFPQGSDTTFVTTIGPAQQTHCQFRSDGPILLNTYINRYVGAVVPPPGSATGVPSAGLLENPSTLVANGVVSKYATLRLRVWDVDSSSNPGSGLNPEMDQVSVNGHPVFSSSGTSTLQGVNQQWVTNEFNVPIEYLYFPSLPAWSQGGPVIRPALAANVVRIDIDTANNSDVWCTAVAWDSLTIGAMEPWMLIHGTNATHTSWELRAVNNTSPVDYLSSLGVPFEYKIDLVPNGDPDGNAALLNQALAANAARFGVNGMHLITHSKGATDSRRFFTTLLPEATNLKILDLYSIGTPSQGTILSNYAVDAQELCSAAGSIFSGLSLGMNLQSPCQSVSVNDPAVTNAFLDAFVANDLLSVVGLAPVDPARALQTIEGMQIFNSNNPKSALVPHYYSIAGDADNNNNHQIDNFGEVQGFFGANMAQATQISLGNRLYQALGRTVALDMAQTSDGGYVLLGVTLRDAPAGNDLVSTLDSVHCGQCGFVPLGGTGPLPTFSFNNHSALKNANTMELIRHQILTDYPMPDAARGGPTALP